MEGAGLCAHPVVSAIPWILVKVDLRLGRQGKKHKSINRCGCRRRLNTHHVLSQRTA